MHQRRTNHRRSAAVASNRTSSPQPASSPHEGSVAARGFAAARGLGCCSRSRQRVLPSSIDGIRRSSCVSLVLCVFKVACQSALRRRVAGVRRRGCGELRLSGQREAGPHQAGAEHGASGSRSVSFLGTPLQDVYGSTCRALTGRRGDRPNSIGKRGSKNGWETKRRDECGSPIGSHRSMTIAESRSAIGSRSLASVSAKLATTNVVDNGVTSCAEPGKGSARAGRHSANL